MRYLLRDAIPPGSTIIRAHARSQMAEAWLNLLCPDHFEAHSAGLLPGVLNPLAAEAMSEVGVDISGKENPGRLRRFQERTILPLRYHCVR
jgi:protein-tyrosine-phosphatase